MLRKHYHYGNIFSSWVDLIYNTKPNKTVYNSQKILCSIILLNTLGKLIEKVFSERLQNQSITTNFVHSN